MPDSHGKRASNFVVGVFGTIDKFAVCITLALPKTQSSSPVHTATFVTVLLNTVPTCMYPTTRVAAGLRSLALLHELVQVAS